MKPVSNRFSQNIQGFAVKSFQDELKVHQFYELGFSVQMYDENEVLWILSADRVEGSWRMWVYKHFGVSRVIFGVLDLVPKIRRCVQNDRKIRFGKTSLFTSSPIHLNDAG